MNPLSSSQITDSPYTLNHQIFIERLLKEYCSQTYTFDKKKNRDFDSTHIDSSFEMIPNNKNNQSMFGGMKNGFVQQEQQEQSNHTNNHKNSTHHSIHQNNNSGLHLSLNYNELTNMQYPTITTNNGNNFMIQNSSTHAPCSNQVNNQLENSSTCPDHNLVNSGREFNHHNNHVNSHLNLSNMFKQQHNSNSSSNGVDSRERSSANKNNQFMNNMHHVGQGNHMNNFNHHPHQQHPVMGQYEPLVQSFSNPFSCGSGNDCGDTTLALEDTCISQFCGVDALNRRKQQLHHLQTLPTKSISNTIECTSSLSPQSTSHENHQGMTIVGEHSLNMQNGTTNKMQSFASSISCVENDSEDHQQHSNGEVLLDQSEDASSSEQLPSPSSRSGKKERVVASSVGKKVNGRYTKLRKQLRTFGGDFTDNYFVLDISKEEKKAQKTGKKRKSSTDHESAEEEQYLTRQHHRSYTISSSNYANNIKMIPEMQNFDCDDMESRRRSSIGPISQSSSNPVILIDSINNTTSFNTQPIMISNNHNNDMSRNNFPNNISPRSASSISREIIPQQEEQTTDNRSVQILLSLLMNSVQQQDHQQQQQFTLESNTNNHHQLQSSLPQSNTPQINLVNNTSQNTTANPNLNDFSFLNMLMRQQTNK